jgi:single-stranded-DNA-specific exonuclease
MERPLTQQLIDTHDATTTMRGMTRLWTIRGGGSGGTLVDRVLAARGVTDPGEIRAILNPSMGALHDPSLIPDLDRAAERILRAAKDGERIVIYGDYDVDGVTASAILVHTLRMIAPGADVGTYIPHRVEEGYGLNAESIDQLADEGARVVVSVDCGITAIEPARRAGERGIDLIITDHHNPPETIGEMPDAFAVVHPRRPDSGYLFGELCGAGVAFKLAWRLATLDQGSDRVGSAMRGHLVEMLALAALGTIADVVPLVDENRIIARFGLSMVRKTRIEGMSALIEASGLGSEKIDTEAVGFRLAPRLNAIGRLGHAREALELLTEARGVRAQELAHRLSMVNEERRAMERRILEQAIELAEAQGMTGHERRAIVLAHEDWHPGVVGIVCSRLVDRYARPAILMTRSEGRCKGSGRSIEGYNLHGAIGSCAEHLTSFGGHDMAAGLGCEESCFDAFAEALVEHANAALTPDDLVRKVTIDTGAGVEELDVPSIESLESIGPFGAGNPKVRVLVEGAVLERDAAPFGKGAKHLSLSVKDPGGSRVSRVIGWDWFDRAQSLRRGQSVDLVVEPAVSRWNGRANPEPVLVDLRVR